MASTRVLIICFLVATVAFLYTDSFIRRLRFKFHRRRPVTRKPNTPLPFCRDDKRTKAKSPKRGVKETFSKRMVSSGWPYNCFYASILRYQGIYQRIIPIEECCEKCKFPAYNSCVVTYGSFHWICPSNGLHCVAKCVRIYDPNLATVQARKKVSSWKTVKPKSQSKVIGGRLTNPKCARKEKVKGKNCIRRLCIPLKV